ncbi:MAG: 2'-5' RNA ligase family protein [Candidatus Paceibacterota bacterium]
MLIFIGCKLKDHNKDIIEESIDKIANKFSIVSLNKKVSPHVTLKAPFEIKDEDLKKLDEFLIKFSSTQKEISFEIDKVSNFDKKVIFLELNGSKKIEGFSNQLTLGLKNFPFILFSKIEKVGKNIFHVTLAKKITENFNEINNYTNSLKIPPLNGNLDNITICEYKDNKWEIYREYNLLSK